MNYDIFIDGILYLEDGFQINLDGTLYLGDEWFTEHGGPLEDGFYGDALPDTSFTNSYFLTDALLETAIGSDPRTAAVALKAASAATQEWYCQQATSNIDRLNFSGYTLLENQARQFPRKYLKDPNQVYPWSVTVVLYDIYGYVYESSDVPDDVLAACKEEAIALYELYSNNDQLTRYRLQRDGVKSVTIGSLSESYGGGRTLRNHLVSEEAYLLLESYLENAPLII